MEWRHYNCDGYDDQGWGCVYRSAQNALLACGVDPPELAEMRAALRGGETRPRRLWVEPGELPPALPPGVRCERLAASGPGMRSSGEADYDTLFCEPENAARVLVQRLREAGRGGAVLDDGVMGRALIYDGDWLLVDPHSTMGARVERLHDAVHRLAELHPHTLLVAILTPE